MCEKFTAHFPLLYKGRMGVNFPFKYTPYIFFEAIARRDLLSTLVSAFGLSSIVLKEALFLFLFLLTLSK